MLSEGILLETPLLEFSPFSNFYTLPVNSPQNPPCFSDLF